jgi:hypothetical protein
VGRSSYWGGSKVFEPLKKEGVKQLLINDSKKKKDRYHHRKENKT